MPCFHPIEAFHAPGGGISFDKSKTLGVPISLPCGQCIGCKLDRSKMWAIRCVHEASLHENNCFLTLTYNDANLPQGGTLIRSHYQKFIKRLRKAEAPHRIRYFMCGEYGDEYRRPHYHALLFGYTPPDGILYPTEGDYPVYTSDYLSDLWGYGYATFGELTYETACYTSRYCTKKITGDQATRHYGQFDEFTGEVIPLEPEYSTQSRRPGVGHDWYKKFSADIFPDDFIIHDAQKIKVPRYYTDKLEIDHPETFSEIKKQRKANAAKHADDNTAERLHEREICQFRKFDRLIRPMEKLQ